MAGLPTNQERAALLRHIPEEIKGLPYFHHRFSDSKSATAFVESCAKGSGHFLLRLSSKGDDFLSLSVSIENGSVRHVNVIIERYPTLKYYIVEQVKFNSFHDLQKYYSDHRICNLEQIENVKLLHPINRGCIDIEEYESLHPASRPLQVQGRKNSEPNFPKTPSAQQLHAQYVEELQNGDEQYLPGAQGGPVTVRRNSSASRPLPRVPNNKDGASRQRQSPNGEDALRPPCPPPPSAGDTDLYYSRPRDESRNRIEELRQILRDAEVCDCGIPLSDSELPQGWTLHKSHDAKTYGCLFYQSSRGDTTWSLPLHIVPEITAQQKNVIVKLSHQSGRPPPSVLMPPYQGSKDGGGGNSGMRNGTKGPQGR